jgi:hypothetical protein
MEIVRLRPLVRRLGFGADLVCASTALARGDSASAIAGLLCLDQSLVERAGSAPEVMHARAGILALTEVLSQHAAYFNAGPAG